MVTQYRCQNERRLSLVRSQPGINGDFLNGIAYLEVSAAPLTLIVYFVHNLPGQTNGVPRDGDSLKVPNFRIEGGVRIKDIQIKSVSAFANMLMVRVNQVGDLSAYRLRLLDSEKPANPPQGFDPQLCEVSFYFQTKTVSEFDCEAAPPPSADRSPPPLIDYLAKDYASFRRLMLDRLATTMPKWQERSPADIGVMLVELLAYRADYLSYYQDAVATEAYLGTARKRVSIRRHARLLDYFLHDGCNARAWVALSVNADYDETTLPGAYELETLRTSPSAYRPTKNCLDRKPRPTQFLTQVASLDKKVLTREEDFQGAIASGAQVFEAMHDITLYSCRNEIHFYTWGDDRCELPKGATAATLVDDPNCSLGQHLKPGDVLVLEEVHRFEGGQLIGPDLEHRHVVRVIEVVSTQPVLTKDGKEKEKPLQDPLTGTPIVQVQWHEEDALPFALKVGTVQFKGRWQALSVVRGNVVLVDHGRTLPDGDEDQVRDEDRNRDEDQQRWLQQKAKHNYDDRWLDEDKYNIVPDKLRYRPQLKRGVLTQRGQVRQMRGPFLPFDPSQPAKRNQEWQLRDVRPCLTLLEHQPYSQQQFVWTPQPDLLNSDRFARDFVVETEDDGKAYLRFGDNLLGKRPEAGSAFEVTYRIGNGVIGNVGAEAITHLYAKPGLKVMYKGKPQSVQSAQALKHLAKSLFKDIPQPIRNPLAARGGIDPESIEQVRRDAPQAFKEQRRAVTDKDYEDKVEDYPGVRKAVVTRRWTGSWYSLCIAIDREDGKPIDDDFTTALKTYLAPFRMSGHDLKFENPRFVPLDLALRVEVLTDRFRNTVKASLLESLSNVDLPNGQRGFFHPDNYTFGQPVYLSKVVQRAMAVEGVSSVRITRFQRWGSSPQGELDAGKISIGRLEIARLDNNANAPEYGRIELTMVGGL